jgi:hypothetical protein
VVRNYGCFIEVADYLDPSLNDSEPPCEWVFQLVHDFLNPNRCFHVWRVYKRDKSALLVLQPWTDFELSDFASGGP